MSKNILVEFIDTKANVKSLSDLIFLTLLLLYFIVYMFPFSEMVGYLPCALMIIYSMSRYSLLKFKVQEYHKWSFQVLLFFLLSSIWALRPILSYWSVMQMIKLMVFTFGIYKYCSNYERLLDVLKVFVFANILFLFFVLFYFDLSTLGQERMSDSENGINGNALAVTFTFCMYCIFIMFKLVRLNVIKRFLYYTLCVLFFIMILFTGSRTALVLIFFPFSFYLFLKSKYKLVSIFMISSFLLLMFIIVMKIPSFYAVIGSRMMDAVNIATGNSTGAEDSSRVLLILYGLEWFKANPFMGIGINNYRVLSNTVYPFVGKNFYAHNNIIELLVDVGLVGLFIYYRYILILIKGVLKIKKGGTIVIIVSCLTITLFINDFVSMSFYEWEMQFLICITFVLLSLLKKREQSIS